MPVSLSIKFGRRDLDTSLDRGDFMSSERDGYNRFDPDSTLNGFFPFWGVVLLLLSCKSFSLPAH